MKYKKFILSSVFLSLMSISQIATAVDGYKNIKFGMSIKQVLALDICTLEKVELNLAGVDYYACADFKFGGDTVLAGTYFIDGKFLRLAISPSIDIALGLASGLSEKYGKPSSMSTQDEFQAFDALPNREAYIGFDQETVYLKLTSDENNIKSAFLVYTSLKFDDLRQQQQQKSLNDDL